MSEIGRKRARNPKTKTGCITCKIRRVKCDEGKPSCARCTSTGRKCDGYESKENGLVKIEDCFQKEDLVSARIGSRGIPGILFGDGQEKRAFEFFRHKTAVEMSGFFPSQFWDGLLLQASHSEPAIFHAVIALGSLHELYRDGKSAVLGDISVSGKRQFALQQSNKAIGYLTKPSTTCTPRSGEAILISCLLFVCLETFQGNHNGAIAHLESGLKILGSMGFFKPDLDTSTIVIGGNRSDQLNLIPLFCRLDMQASTYFPRRQLFYDSQLGDQDYPVGPAVPKEFSSMDEANTSLQSQVYAIVRYTQLVHKYHEAARLQPKVTVKSQMPRGLLVSQIEHKKQLSRWLTTMNGFLKAPKAALTPQELRGAVLLKMQQITINIMLASTIFNDQTEYDDLTAEFERVTVLAANLLASSNCSEVEQRPYCSFDMSVIPSLYNAACRCRDPIVRRKAIALLLNSARREGIWDSDVSAAIAQRIMEIEEEGLGPILSAQSVPMEARIHILDKAFVSGERKCFVRFEKGKTGLIEEWITW
ncbi:hypothetical protein BKA65DRAFT_500924 [Rhexocercosporidium sp. MPI-PUGE-AT-0058]|nr:hypothetical protein BKA65DRAFT_500924 [Rhexocercosporidium sp. MPI-PUGE-AT-0058]